MNIFRSKSSFTLNITTIYNLVHRPWYAIYQIHFWLEYNSCCDGKHLIGIFGYNLRGINVVLNTVNLSTEPMTKRFEYMTFKKIYNIVVCYRPQRINK